MTTQVLHPRIICKAKLKNILAENNIPPNETLIDEIEKKIYEKTLEHTQGKDIKENWKDGSRFQVKYCEYAKDLLINIDPNSHVGNKTLLSSIFLSKTVSPTNLIKLRYYELFQERWSDIMTDQSKREDLLLNQKEVGSEIYQCKKCKARNTRSTQAQTRSADEATTVFITCLNCGEKWTHS